MIPLVFIYLFKKWIFPLAIACGNTCIIKPSEKDPGAMVYYIFIIHIIFIKYYHHYQLKMILAELAQQAGVFIF